MPLKHYYYELKTFNEKAIPDREPIKSGTFKANHLEDAQFQILGITNTKPWRSCKWFMRRWAAFKYTMSDTLEQYYSELHDRSVSTIYVQNPKGKFLDKDKNRIVGILSIIEIPPPEKES